VIAESPTGVETAGQKFVVKCEILPEDGLLCEALVTSRGRPALLRYMAQAYLAGLQAGGRRFGSCGCGDQTHSRRCAA